MTTTAIPRSNLASRLIQQARISRGISLREMARRAGTSHATLSAYINGTKSPTTDTLLRILTACGFALDADLRPRIRQANGLTRGEELAQVLRLAGQFPTPPRRPAQFPVFPRKPA